MKGCAASRAFEIEFCGWIEWAENPSETGRDLDVTVDIVSNLEKRLGRLHARQRLGLEKDYEARIFGRGLNFFHIENWHSSHSIIRSLLKISGLYWRGLRNAKDIQVRHNHIVRPDVPPNFDGFTILQISDLHVEMNGGVISRLAEILAEIKYDLCALTGDYRGLTFGPYQDAVAGVARLSKHLSPPVYGVLGNHDTIKMVPGLEAIGIRMLLNECATIERGGQRIHIVGVDDAHYYRVDNIEKAILEISHDEFSVLLSHTPEIYRHAAHAGFNLLLAGHTHGGQICLPGGIPMQLNAVLPRHMGSGPWQYQSMTGYTSAGVGCSIVPVRFNCPPEITLHTLHVA